MEDEQGADHWVDSPLILSYVILRCWYIHDYLEFMTRNPFFDRWFKQQLVQVFFALMGFAAAINPLYRRKDTVRTKAVFTWFAVIGVVVFSAFFRNESFWSSPEAFADAKDKISTAIFFSNLIG